MKPTPKTTKLFKDQPKFTNADIERLTKAGLLVAEKTQRIRPNCEDELTNPTAGQVVGIRYLAEKLKNREVTSDDAKRLLAVEACRDKGPRNIHVDRLMVVAFRKERDEVFTAIAETAKAIHHGS